MKLTKGKVMDERAIFEKGPVVLFKWRNASGWPVEYVSTNVKEVLGFSAEQFLSGEIAYSSIVDENDLPRVAQEVVDASTNQASQSFAHEPYRIQRKDGQTRWFFDYTYIIRSDAGEVTHYFGYIFDITSRVMAEIEKSELERRLLHTQKLESLGVLAGGVAHDFNNLLTGILGNITLAQELFKDHKGDVICKKISKHINMIQALTGKAADLTRQLLAYSGKGTYIIEPIDLVRLVTEMSEVIDVAIAKRAPLFKYFEPGLPQIIADRVQIEQVLMNLLTNASEALIGKEGKIELSLQRKVIHSASDIIAYDQSELQPGNYVVLTVSDTGCGMSKEEQARLFDPFFTTKSYGRGLGMSSVLGIIRSHKGAIVVDSIANQGTTFRIFLPAHHAIDENDPSALHSSSSESSAPNLGTALVIDDEDYVRETMRLLLQDLGYQVIDVSNGMDGLEVYQKKQDQISFILLDLTMPVLSGSDTLKQLCAINPSVRVILTSGYTEQHVQNLLKEFPHVLFLKKPFGLDELEAIVQRVTK